MLIFGATVEWAVSAQIHSDIPAVAAAGEGDLARAQRRVAELERKIGQQQVDLDFFRRALRHVRERR